ncbi:hypothetical protein GGR54DRAFT_609418 [Hypoxylon sp. NC1633]|nr:hypothetical protein GGR54DRAFT_609418 [Hypoxylon sp. NC1633]
MYTKKIPVAIALMGGCILYLDLLGLPASPRISHSPTCACAGRQEEQLLRHLEEWRTEGGAQILQIDPRCAATIIIRLINKWDLGTRDTPASLLEDIQGWRAELAMKAMPNNPLAKARVAKRKHVPRKVAPAMFPSAINGFGL